VFKHAVLTLPGELKQHSYLLPAEPAPARDAAVQDQCNCACSRGSDEVSVSDVKITGLAGIKADAELGCERTFNRTWTSSSAYFPSKKRSWLRINCVPNIVAVFALPSAHRKGRGLAAGHFPEGSALGVRRWDAAALPQPASNPARAGLPERRALVQGRGGCCLPLAQHPGSRPCTLVVPFPKGRDGLGRSPAGLASVAAGPRVLLISNSACSVGCPGAARVPRVTSHCLSHLHCSCLYAGRLKSEWFFS